MGRDWQTVRESALEAKGRDWADTIVTLIMIRKSAPYVAAAIALGALGYLAREAWLAVTSISVAAAPDTGALTEPVAAGLGAVPVWVWIASVALVLVAAFTFRPGRIVLRSYTRVVEVTAIVIGFAGLAGVALAAITGG